MAEHTKGPWIARPHHTHKGIYQVETANGQIHVPYVFGHAATAPYDCLTAAPESCKANANLIAAAPDLLEACKDIHSFLNESNNAKIANYFPGSMAYSAEDLEHLDNLLRKAIARAEGKGR